MNLESRRKFLKMSVGTAGLLAMSTSLSRALAASCGLTPPQTPGPFYPGEAQFTPTNDLTVLPGQSKRADGQIVYVRGIVRDSLCNPVVNANVEIWQACASGRYNNAKDENTAALDPNFRYWGEAFTDEQGGYLFKTIIPGAYPADMNWTRPPHIHVKVSKLGYKELVTQLYFKGNILNDSDLILQDIPANQRSSVIVDFQPSPVGLEPGTKLGQFDITIQSIR